MAADDGDACRLYRRMRSPAFRMENQSRVFASIYDRFTASAIRLGGYSSPERLLHRCKTIFNGIDLADKDLLEIGAGAGVLSGYAVVRGARAVVALEPEAAGSTQGCVSRIRQMQDALSVPNFTVLNCRIQEYSSQNRSFDIVLLYNSINHIDEEACASLHSCPSSRQSYLQVFTRISTYMRPGAALIIADCSRYNMWPMFHLSNPFARSIEWWKHQSPRTWCTLLSEIGFIKRNLSYYQYFPFRHFGYWTANPIIAFCLNSHFRLHLEYTTPQHR